MKNTYRQFAASHFYMSEMIRQNVLKDDLLKPQIKIYLHLMHKVRYSLSVKRSLRTQCVINGGCEGSQSEQTEKYKNVTKSHP
jgi:hypothetical protein